MITATVTIKTASMCIVYDAIGFSAAAIDASARDMYGDDEPIGVTVLVLQ